MRFQVSGFGYQLASCDWHLASGYWLLATTTMQKDKRKAHGVKILSSKLKSGFSILCTVIYALRFFALTPET